MNLIPHPNASRDLISELLDFQTHMNDLFDVSLGRRSDRNRWLTAAAWSPAIDLVEEKDRYVVKAEVPGLSKDDLDVSIEQGVLVLKGEKKEESEKKEKGVLRSERFYGAFQRAIALPAAVDEANVKATYKNGIVEIAVPKRPDARPKSIKIDVA